MNTETVEKPYAITYEQCKHLISENEFVCMYCGGQLEPLETVDNSGTPTHWAGCKSCERFNWGGDKKVVSIASDLVRKHGYVAYEHMRKEKEGLSGFELENWYRSQTYGAYDLVRKVLALDFNYKTR